MIDEDIFSIDENLLDVEWMNQPKLFFKWSEKLTKAEDRLDEAERELKAIDAEIDNEIRKSGEKITDTGIKNRVILNKRHRRQEELIAEKRHRVRLLNGVVKSLDQRKKALEKLADLHGQQYFATPKASHRSQELIDKILNRAFISKDRKEK